MADDTVPLLTRDELASMGGLPPAVLAAFSPDAQDGACLTASQIARGEIGVQVAGTLSTIPGSLKFRIAQIAARILMRQRGFNPSNEPDKSIETDYQNALEWLADVRTGEIALVGVVDATPEVDEASPIVISSPPRGWSEEREGDNGRRHR
jgi:hypothetical protein